MYIGTCVCARVCMRVRVCVCVKVWAVELTQTHRHTDRHTDTHTHTHRHPRSILTYSVKMTEYKKRKNLRCADIISSDLFSSEA